MSKNYFPVETNYFKGSSID